MRREGRQLRYGRGYPQYWGQRALFMNLNLCISHDRGDGIRYFYFVRGWEGANC